MCIHFKIFLINNCLKVFNNRLLFKLLQLHNGKKIYMPTAFLHLYLSKSIKILMLLKIKTCTKNLRKHYAKVHQSESLDLHVI